MARRGKQGDDRYISISARVPKDLRKAVKHRQIDEDITLDDLLEQLLSLWVSGDVTLPEATEAAPQPSPVASKPKTPKASPPRKPTEGTTELASILEQLGISGNELGRRLDIASGTISRYVNGSRATPPEVLQAAKDMLEPTEGED